MSYPDRSTRNPNPIYNPYARKPISYISPYALLSDEENYYGSDTDSDSDTDSNTDNKEQTFSSSYYEPKPRPSAYGDVDGYYSDEYESDDDYKNYYVNGMTGELHYYRCNWCNGEFGHKRILGIDGLYYCCDDCNDEKFGNNNDDCSSNCSAHDVTEEEVINWMIEDGEVPAQAPVRRSARIAHRVQKYGPTSYVEMNSGVSKAKVSKKASVVEQKPVVDEAPVRRSARIARRAQKYGPTSYVGMDSVEPEGEGDFITDIWYDYSVHYDSDYELPEEKKMREKEERREKYIENFIARRQAKWAKEEAKEAKKELANAKKANKQMYLDIQEQIAEDIAKLTLDTKLTDEEYFQILKLKQNTDQVLTWKELNFVTDYAISQMKQEQKESSLDTKPQHNNDNDNDNHNDNDNLRCSNLISKQHNGQQLSWDELCFVVSHKLTDDGYYNLLKSKQRNCQVLTRDELETMVWSFRY